MVKPITGVVVVVVVVVEVVEVELVDVDVDVVAEVLVVSLAVADNAAEIEDVNEPDWNFSVVTYVNEELVLRVDDPVEVFSWAKELLVTFSVCATFSPVVEMLC